MAGLRGKFKAGFFDVLVVLAIVVYVTAAVVVSLNRFWQFDAFWYDMGLYDTAIWKVARFEAPVVEQFAPPYGKAIFADHFNLSLFLLSPVYWLTDKSEALLILQAVMVGGSAWIGYLIIRRVVKNKLAEIALLTSYLGFVGLQNALYTDFHDTTVATFFVMLCFWAIFNKKWKLFWLSFVAVLGFKETMAGLGAGIGLFLILKRKREVQRGMIAVMVSVLWLLLATKVIIPGFAGSSYNYQPEWPSSAISGIWAFFVPFDLKARTLLFSFLTFGFAPLFSVAMAPVILEHYLERFVLSQAATRWDLGLHYNALISPLFLMASLPFVVWLKGKSRAILKVWAVLTIATVVFLHRFYLHGPLLLATHPVFYQQTERAQFLRDFINEIPREGLVMTQNNLATYFTHNRVVLLNLKEIERINPDVVALDLRGGQNANNFFPIGYGEAKELADYLSESKRYEKRKVASDQLIFVRR